MIQRNPPMYILWQCTASSETRGTRKDEARRKPCGHWNTFKTRLPVLDSASSHRPFCKCGRRKRLSRKDVEIYAKSWEADKHADKRNEEAV